MSACCWVCSGRLGDCFCQPGSKKTKYAPNSNDTYVCHDKVKCKCGLTHDLNGTVTLCGCTEFRPAEETKPESVYEWARKKLNDGVSLAELSGFIQKLIDAGKAAETRAKELETSGVRLLESYNHEIERVHRAHCEIAQALALLKPARPEDGLLPAIREILQQLVLERETGKEARDALEWIEHEEPGGTTIVARALSVKEPSGD
jgi:hypothetical protein